MKPGRPKKGEIRIRRVKPLVNGQYGLRMWQAADCNLAILRLHRDDWASVTTRWTLALDYAAADYCRTRLAWCNAEIARRIGE